MGKQSIKISISPIGQVKVEASGFIGGSCKDATANIIAALSDGKGNDNIEEKPELYQEETETQFECY